VGSSSSSSSRSSSGGSSESHAAGVECVAGGAEEGREGGREREQEVGERGGRELEGEGVAPQPVKRRIEQLQYMYACRVKCKGGVRPVANRTTLPSLPPSLPTCKWSPGNSSVSSPFFISTRPYASSFPFDAVSA